MTYPLLVGETTAVMWKATGHGWNPLEKIMCSLFEKGVPASILVWTLTLLVNRAWL